MSDLESILRAHDVSCKEFRPLYQVDDETVYYFQSSGGTALDQWYKVRDLVVETGYWPVVLGTNDDLEHHRWSLDPEKRRQSLEAQAARPGVTEEYHRFLLQCAAAETFGPTAQELVEAATEMDVLAFLQQGLVKTQEIDDETMEQIIDAISQLDWGQLGFTRFMDKYQTAMQAFADSGLDLDLPREDWPEQVESLTQFTVPFGKSASQEIYVGLVPTIASWQIPAFLRFTAVNFNYAPQVSAAMFRRWQALYGAEIVAVSADTIEAAVSNPPHARAQAIELALEQYAYCPDIVDQGAGSIDTLAALLLDGTVWYFWWD